MTAVAVLVLALGIGLTTSAFSVLDAVVLRPLPFPRPDELIWAGWLHRPTGLLGGGNNSPLSAVAAWSKAPVVSGIAPYFADEPIYEAPSGATRIESVAVPSAFFTILEVSPQIGRVVVGAEDGAGATPVVVLSNRLWVGRLGRDQNVVGKSVRLDTLTYQVIGVMPAEFDFPVMTDAWTNLGTALSGPQGSRLALSNRFDVLIRLKPHVSTLSALSSLDAAAHTSWMSDFKDWSSAIVPLRDIDNAGFSKPLILALVAAALVLLVACVNTGAIFTLRTMARRNEVALRLALGAGRASLVTGILIESLMIASAACVLGVAVAAVLLPIISVLTQGLLPVGTDLAVDHRVLIAAVLFATIASIIFAIGPAIAVIRGAPASSLRGGQPGSPTDSSRFPLPEMLTSTQIALTVVLLIGAGVLARSFTQLMGVDRGFDAADVYVGQLALSSTYSSPDRKLAWSRAVITRAQSIPGVRYASVATSIPFAGGEYTSLLRPGQDTAGTPPMGWVVGVSTDYFRVLGIRLMRGRWLDGVPGQHQVLVDQAAVHNVFHDADPIGQPLQMFGDSAICTVVGVVGNTLQKNLTLPAPPHVYALLDEHSARYVKVLVRTVKNGPTPVSALRTAIASIDPGIPVDNIGSMNGLLLATVAPARFYLVLVGCYAFVALVLAGTGIYGLVSHLVMRRQREIGIRMALGATSAAIARLVSRRIASIVLAGICVGLAISVLAVRSLRSLLFDVAPVDPSSILVVVTVIAVVALVASYFSAKPAISVDPAKTLRQQ